MLPYEQTKGNEAVELYNSTGRTAQEWQEIQLYDIMAINDEGLWTHMKYGYSVPRRNGKSEILIMRALWGLIHGERVLYTAHRTTTSHNAWEKVIERLAKQDIPKKRTSRPQNSLALNVSSGSKIMTEVLSTSVHVHQKADLVRAMTCSL